MIGLVLPLLVSLIPQPPAAPQPPRDPRPPAIAEANRERELRAAIAAHAASEQTYFELARLLQQQDRFDDAIAALQALAAFEPASPQPLHIIGTLYWEKVSRDQRLTPEMKLTYISEGIRAEDRALVLKPDFVEAKTYRDILQRMRANLSAGPQESPTSLFGESFDQTVARLQPMRIGRDLPTPMKTRDVKPRYPPQAQAARAQGIVIIEAVIGPDGKIANARILRSTPMLDAGALDAVRQWEFTPTLLNGVPVSIIMTVTVSFHVQ